MHREECVCLCVCVWCVRYQFFDLTLDFLIDNTENHILSTLQTMKPWNRNYSALIKGLGNILKMQPNGDLANLSSSPPLS